MGSFLPVEEDLTAKKKNLWLHYWVFFIKY